MKKLAALLMILSLGLFTAVGCSSESTPAAKDKAPAAGAKAGADKKGYAGDEACREARYAAGRKEVAFDSLVGAANDGVGVGDSPRGRLSTDILPLGTFLAKDATLPSPSGERARVRASRE